MEDGINPHGLTTFTAAVTIISECIGAGMVSLPLTYLRTGVFVTLLLLLYSVVRITSSCYILLKTKDVIPGKPESLFEMGYILIGRPFIFIMSFTLFTYCTFLTIAYFFLFGGVVSSLIKGQDETRDDFVSSMYFSVLLLAFMLLFIIFRKEVHELKIVAWILFFFLVAFLVLSLGLALGNQNGEFLLKEASFVSLSSQLVPAPDLDYRGIITAINTASFSLSITSNLFPTYSSLKKKTTRNMLHALWLGLFMTICVYTLYSMVCMTLFGEDLYVSEGNSLKNMGINFKKIQWAGITLEVLYMIVLAAHIPFMFFVGKEALLIMLDEIDRKSVSETLNKRLEFYNQIHGAEITITNHNEGNPRANAPRSAATEIEVRGGTKVLAVDPTRIGSLVQGQIGVLDRKTNKERLGTATTRNVSFANQ